MKFIVDANLPRSLCEILTSRGHDVVDVRLLKPFPLPDPDIYRIACSENRIIVTRDLDFGNVLLYDPKKTAGIIVLRLLLLPIPEIIKTVVQLLAQLPEKDMRGRLVIAEPHRYRIHSPFSPD